MLPLFHIYALTDVLLRGLQEGNELLLRVRFDVATTLHDIEVKKATAFPGVPTMWIALANTPDIDKRDLSSLRYAASGGAALPVEVAERFQTLTGQRLGGGWGMTETSPAGTALPRDWTARPARSACRCRASTWTSSRSRIPGACCPPARRARSASRARM